MTLFGAIPFVINGDVPKTKFEGKTLEQRTINDVFAFLTLYFFIFLAALFLLSFDGVNGQTVTVVSDAGTYEVKYSRTAGNPIIIRYTFRLPEQDGVPAIEVLAEPTAKTA